MLPSIRVTLTLSLTPESSGLEKKSENIKQHLLSVHAKKDEIFFGNCVSCELYIRIVPMVSGVVSQ